MKIDYFCFSVPNLNSTDYVLNKKDDENIIWVKNNEKELMNQAKECDMLILFDRETKKFYKDNNEFDVQDKTIFPRCFIPYVQELLTELVNNGAYSIDTVESNQKIMNWPQFIQPIHRKVIPTTYGEFEKNHEKYKIIFNKVFLKTAIKSGIHCSLKHYGNVEMCGNKIFYIDPPLFYLSSNDEIFLTETFDSIEEPQHNLDCSEYRIFVVDNSLLSISRSYADYTMPIPSEVREFAQNQIIRASLTPEFPSSYVLDIGQILMNGKQVIDIIEYNPICSAGLEVNNTLIDKLKSQEKDKQLRKSII